MNNKNLWGWVYKEKSGTDPYEDNRSTYTYYYLSINCKHFITNSCFLVFNSLS